MSHVTRAIARLVPVFALAAAQVACSAPSSQQTVPVAQTAPRTVSGATAATPDCAQATVNTPVYVGATATNYNFTWSGTVTNCSTHSESLVATVTSEDSPPLFSPIKAPSETVAPGATYKYSFTYSFAKTQIVLNQVYTVLATVSTTKSSTVLASQQSKFYFDGTTVFSAN